LFACHAVELGGYAHLATLAVFESLVALLALAVRIVIFSAGELALWSIDAFFRTNALASVVVLVLQPTAVREFSVLWK
jgi:hypothetical protein